MTISQTTLNKAIDECKTQICECLPIKYQNWFIINTSKLSQITQWAIFGDTAAALV